MGADDTVTAAQQPRKRRQARPPEDAEEHRRLHDEIAQAHAVASAAESLAAVARLNDHGVDHLCRLVRLVSSAISDAYEISREIRDALAAREEG